MGEAPSYPKKAPIGSIFVVLAMLVAFVVITFFLRASRPEAESYDAKRAQARVEIRDTTLAKSRELVGSAAWVDKEKGIARIPVSDAMGLAVSQLSTKPVAASAVPVPTNSPAGAASPSPAAGDSSQASPTATDLSVGGASGALPAPVSSTGTQLRATEIAPASDAARSSNTPAATTAPTAN